MGQSLKPEGHLRLANTSNNEPSELKIGDGRNDTFQIDANFGIAGAMLSCAFYSRENKLMGWI